MRDLEVAIWFPSLFRADTSHLLLFMLLVIPGLLGHILFSRKQTVTDFTWLHLSGFIFHSFSILLLLPPNFKSIDLIFFKLSIYFIRVKKSAHLWQFFFNFTMRRSKSVILIFLFALEFVVYSFEYFVIQILSLCSVNLISQSYCVMKV